MPALNIELHWKVATSSRSSNPRPERADPNEPIPSPSPSKSGSEIPKSTALGLLDRSRRNGNKYGRLQDHYAANTMIGDTKLTSVGAIGATPSFTFLFVFHNGQ